MPVQSEDVGWILLTLVVCWIQCGGRNHLLAQQKKPVTCCKTHIYTDQLLPSSNFDLTHPQSSFLLDIIQLTHHWHITTNVKGT